MNRRQLVEMLTEFGVIVCSEHHLQIPVGGRKHNIYITKFNQIKFQPAGSSQTHRVSARQLIGELQGYKYENTDLAAMQVASMLQRSKGVEGVFVDAGFKNGQARIAIVRRHRVNDLLDLRAWTTNAASSQDAEELAVRTAQNLFPGEEIYTDCKPVADRLGVHWIARERNDIADKVSSLRGS